MSARPSRVSLGRESRTHIPRDWVAAGVSSSGPLRWSSELSLDQALAVDQRFWTFPASINPWRVLKLTICGYSLKHCLARCGVQTTLKSLCRGRRFRLGNEIARGELVLGFRHGDQLAKEGPMHGPIYLIGLIVVILAILSLFGLR